MADVRTFRLESNDPLDGAKQDWLVDRTSGRRCYSKTRHLEETEVVSTVLSHSTSPPTPCWTIHRPRHGWYLALRPSLPTPSTSSTLGPSGFVPLEPLRTRSAARSGTQLAFALTLPPSSASALPTPSLTTASTTNSPSPSVEITMPPLDSAGASLAAASAGLGGEATARFVLRALPPPPREAGLWSAVKAGGSGLMHAVVGAPRPGWACFAVLQEGEEEVMRWEDTTSAFATTTAGVLHLAERLPTLPGIDQSFWVAVALAFIDFTDDQDAYLAAAQGD